MVSRGELFRSGLFGLVVVLVVLGRVTGTSSTAFSYVRELAFHEFFVLVLLVLYVFRPVSLIPLSGLHLVAGFVFGGALGVVVAMVGTVLTALPVYAAGTHFSPSAGIGGWLARRGESTLTQTGGLRGMVAASLSPVPADAVAYTAGASGVPPRVFLVGLVVGEVPWVAAYVFVGRSMTVLSLSGATDLVGLVAVLSVLSLLVVARPAYDALLGIYRDH